jgi:hypothetical protein
MFSGFTGHEFPDRQVLLVTILESVGTLDARGTIDLTERQADRLRAAGYMTALGAGRWPVPQLPLEMLRPHPSLADLARFWYGANALTPPPPLPSQTQRGSFFSPERSVRFSLAFFALRDASQRIVLMSLARRGPTKRRRLQQAHGRCLPAARFNPALTALLQANLVVQSSGLLSVNPLAIAPLMELTGAVCRTGAARSQRRSERRAGSTEKRRRPTAPRAKSRRRRPYRRRPIPDRRADPRGWALSMLGRRAGLARQRQARNRGEHSTAKATVARLAKHRRRRRVP